MSVEKLSNKLDELQNYVKHVCSAEIQLSKDWHEKTDEIFDIVLSAKKDVDLKGKVCKFIESCYKDTKVSKQRANNLNALLTNDRKKVEELRIERENLKKEYEEVEKEIKFHGEVISDRTAKNLLKFELTAQACKILTGTDFEYGCSQTSGYMHNQATDVLEVFSLDSIDKERKKEYLWTLMSKVYPIKLNID